MFDTLTYENISSQQNIITGTWISIALHFTNFFFILIWKQIIAFI